MAFGIGIGTVGAQNCNNGVRGEILSDVDTAPPASAGLWRWGGSARSSDRVVGGILLSTHVDIRTIFLFATIPPLVATGAYLAMGRRLELHPQALKD